MGKILEQLQEVVRKGGQASSIAKLLGFHVTHVEPGSATVEIEITGQYWNPLGTLHGGVLCDIADAAMGLAYASGLEDGESFTTLELKINFLKPIWNARLKATANMIRRGRTIGLVECKVLDGKASLVAHSTSTC